MEEILYWVVVSLLKGDQTKLIRESSLKPLREIYEGKIKEKIASCEDEYIKKAESIVENCRRKNIDIIPYQSSSYPELIKNSRYPPPVLYLRGNLKVFKEWAMAIVGTRKPTHYGRNVAKKLARELAESGALIVSGGARGIDTEAHIGAIEANGETVAVMGCGLDRYYPAENKRLFSKIEENGTLISEFPPGVPPLPHNFPRRNRIIASLSRGVVVVEASKKSGALHTVRWALDEGREVFSIPGPITSELSEGTNMLIKDGAKLVTSVDDILEEFGFVLKRKEYQATEISREESTLLSILSLEPMHLDEIIRNSNMNEGEVSSLLLSLELKGLVTQLPGKYYVKNV